MKKVVEIVFPVLAIVVLLILVHFSLEASIAVWGVDITAWVFS